MKKLAVILLVLINTNCFACTTIVVGKMASETGEIMFGRNSDTNPASRAKHLKIYQGDVDKARFLALPYYNSEAEDGMLQVATNEYGVAISATQTIAGNAIALKFDPYIPGGISEFNVTKPVMEKARTAQQAVELIGMSIESAGASEGFGIVIADKREVWYLETASSRHWVAVRVPDDSYLVSANQGRIQEIRLNPNGTYADGYMGSKDLIVFAKDNEFYREREGQFDFRLTYQRIIDKKSPEDVFNDVNYNYLRVATLQNKFSGRPIEGFENGIMPTFLKPISPLTENDIKEGLSDFYQGTANDPYHDPNATPQYRPISIFRASNSHVTVVRDMEDQNLANVEYIALGMPSLSIYLPFYYGMRKVPEAYTIGHGCSDDDPAFWTFRKLQALVFTDFMRNASIVHARFDDLSRRIKTTQKNMEDQYSIEFNSEKKLAIIQKFIDETVELALTLTRELTTELEQHYMYTHPDSVFTNEFYDQLTSDIYTSKYKFPGF